MLVIEIPTVCYTCSSNPVSWKNSFHCWCQLLKESALAVLMSSFSGIKALNFTSSSEASIARDSKNIILFKNQKLVTFFDTPNVSQDGRITS